MPHSEAFEAVFKLEERLGASWRNLRAAHGATASRLDQLSGKLQDLVTEDGAIVALGSLGRFESTANSDIDWTYLVDGQANIKHQENAKEAERRIKDIGTEPGPEGVFGVLAFSHDIVQYIGGRDDTNANLTRRILLLLESKPVGRDDAHRRVVRAVLDRYLTDDYGWSRRTARFGVPRFLLNDIARYWRTVAVDFAYKQRTRGNKGWALRSAKLRMSRKLMYAAGLLYCFSLAPRDLDDTDAKAPSKAEAIEQLWRLTGRTPMDLVAGAFDDAEDAAGGKDVFGAYDEFLGILSDQTKRNSLKNLMPEQAPSDDLYQHIRQLGHQFQAGLNTLFLPGRPSRLRRLIEEYGVF